MKIQFIINPFQNLIYHLERASESFKELFSEKYKAKAENLTPASTFIEFARALNQTIISQSLKQRLSDLVMPDEIPTTVNQIFSGFAARLTEVLLGDVDRYLNVWREELQPKLESFQKALKSIKKDVEERFKRIETLTLIPFKFDQLEIFLVDALSEEYGSMSEILGLRSLALGIMNTTEALKEIAFSLAKLNLGDIISKNLPEELTEEEQNINNALAKLIVNEIQTFLTMPLEVKNKVDEYVTLLWADWKNYAQNPAEYRDIGHFFRAVLLPRLLGEAPEIVVEEVIIEEEEEEPLIEEVVIEEVVEEEEEEPLIEEVVIEEVVIEAPLVEEVVIEEEEEEPLVEEVVIEEEEEEPLVEEVVIEEVVEEEEEEPLISEKAEMLDEAEEARRRRAEEEEEARWRIRRAEETRRIAEEARRRRAEEEEARWRTRRAEETRRSEEEM